MSSHIIGRKVEKDILYNIDGQPIQNDTKVLKIIPNQQTQLIQKIDQSKKNSNKSKQEQNKQQSESKQKIVKQSEKQLTQKNNTKIQKTVFNNITNQNKVKNSKSRSPSLNKSSSSCSSASVGYKTGTAYVPYREPRQFKPLSEQFPNLTGATFKQREFTADISEDSYISQREEAEDKIRSPPKPTYNPQSAKNVQEIIKQNNHKFVLSKKEEAEKKERIRQEKLQQRKLMQQYGKEQIRRAFTQSEFEQKYTWGANQQREQQQKEKQEKLSKDKEKKQQIKENINDNLEEQKKQINLHEIFQAVPEESKYRKIWDEEAKKAVDKRQYSLIKKQNQQQHSTSCKTQKSTERKIVYLDVEQNAKSILQEIKKQKQSKIEENLLKKHKIDYIDRQAKQIISSMKTRPFKPSKSFDNTPSVFFEKVQLPKEDNSVKGVQQLFENAENEAEEFTEQGTIQFYQNKVKNGKVMSTREVKQFQEDQKQKEKKINKFKQDLKNKKHVTLKNPQPLTEKEQQIKKELDQAIDIPKEVQQKQQKLNKTGIDKQKKQSSYAFQQAAKTNIEQPDLNEFIFAEAELPQFKGEYQQEDRIGFREQVEQEIKQQILMQKQKRPIIKVDKEIKQQKGLQITIKPQQRNGPIYRQETKSTSQTRYPVYHDLGEVQLLEDDMYQAQHSNWSPKLVRKIIDNSSDEDDETDIIQKSSLGLKSNLKSTKNKTYSRSVQGKKSVYFREPYSDLKKQENNLGNNYLTDQKAKFMKIIENQKSRGQVAVSDDDSDIEIFQGYSPQIWLATDPMKRDVFIMTAKELMELPQIQL